MARQSTWEKARRPDQTWSRALMRVAKIVGRIVQQFGRDSEAAVRALQDYGRVIQPWARSQSRQMVQLVEKRDLDAWKKHSQAIGTQLRRDVTGGDISQRVHELVDEGADLISSLPWEAAKRVTDLSLEAALDGKRAPEIFKEIMRSGEVAEGRARLIARTEVGRATSAITQARAEKIGSKGYIWRTSKDSDVRPSHRAMAGRFVAWDDPPTLDGMVGHAGALPNCRCYAEPVLPDEDEE